MHFLAGLGPFGVPELIVISILLATLGIWVWSLIDCARRESGATQAMWLVGLILTGFIGSIVYFFARYLPRPKPNSGA
jgi:hypothetical protein